MSFSGMIAAVFKTLIVMNIIDNVFSDSEVQDCTRYIQNLYNDETDPLKIFQIGFSSLNKKVIEQNNKLYGTATEYTTDLKKLDMIIKKMNKHTKKYFHQVLHDIKIVGKESLPNPLAFCEEHFESDVTSPTLRLDLRVQYCTAIIKRYFGYDMTGAEIFDMIYKTLTENDVNDILSFNNERSVFDDIRYDYPYESDLENMLAIYYDSIFSYYYLLKSILNIADVSGFTTPENFCEEEINGLVFKDCEEEFGETLSP